MQLLTLIPAILAALPALSAADSFADSCDQYRVLKTDEKGYVLQAKCSSDSYNGYSALQLDWCVANDEGDINARANGGLTSSCSDGCSIMTGIPELRCLCDPQPEGEFRASTLDLTPTVTNNGGILECFGQTGWETSEPASTSAI
ncbi:hypothetical protein P170DRAFT_472005 [Aspergillus steynii IBT 23096]|uniref:Cyanovirin-N domain-containing protein n=1 Tax=Aspergillus steynii IBT 23096 TaxID=1392250 RepID=A0A2I2GGU0_9EURO|nr:uncharacterized protein P170DRAFT_472005 [Aspergillus steynii IBT 23096]PLB52098.1 hypothetical protein P170DRAFT_472005 [Aspergillus steynii IBT 23096]